MNGELVRRLTMSLSAALLSVGLAMPVLADEAKPAEQGKSAEQPKATEKPKAAPKGEKKAKARPPQVWEPADKPAIKMGTDQGAAFLKRHEGFLQDLKEMKGDVGLLFVGDSITDGWRTRGKETFEKAFSKYKPLNIGIGGDKTQHVIWRLENGEVEGISPKAAVMMIGTNNLAVNKDEEIVAGITKCVQTLHEKLPKTKLLLLAVFPRAESATDPLRDRIKKINEQIKKLDDGGKTVKYLDIGPKFLEPDGTLPKSIMPDSLHPNDKGYEIWADAIGPSLEELTK